MLRNYISPIQIKVRVLVCAQSITTVYTFYAKIHGFLLISYINVLAWLTMQLIAHLCVHLYGNFRIE